MEWRTDILEALVVVVLSAGVALAFNALREDGIPLVAETPYKILVPCPEPGGEVEPLEPEAVGWGSRSGEMGRDDLVVDAREKKAYENWHAPGALHVPFDYLEPVSDERVSELISTGASRVVVYGDGGRPDTGEELARELSGRGVRNVHYVPGGAAAVRAALEPGSVTEGAAGAPSGSSGDPARAPQDSPAPQGESSPEGERAPEEGP